MKSRGIERTFRFLRRKRRPASAALLFIVASSAGGFADAVNAQTLDGFAPLVDGGGVQALAIQADGAILAGGTFSSIDGGTHLGLARIATDATVDASFTPSIDEIDVFGAMDLALQPDGRLLVADGLALDRIDNDGGVDATFHTEKLWASRLCLQNDGKIVVGEFAGLGRVLRLLPDGTTDDAFHASTMQNGWVGQFVQQPDGKILVAGGFDAFGNDTDHAYFVRLNTDGTPDDSFDPHPNAPVTAIALLPDGDMLAAGLFTVIGGSVHGGFARLDKNGHPRASFSHEVTGTTIRAMAFDNYGVVIVGDFSAIDGTARANAARIDWDDSLDAGFDPQVDGIVDSIAVQGDGKILIGGFMTQVGNHFRNRLARLNADGSVDDLFGAGTDGAVQALAAWPDNSLAIGGAYTRIESTQGAQVAMPGLAWIKADGDDPVAGFVPQEICTLPFCAVNAIALQPDDRKIVPGHTFFSVSKADGAQTPASLSSSHADGGNPNDALPVMRLFSNGLLDPPFDLNVASFISGDVHAVLRQPDGKFLVAGCMQIDTTANVLLIRIDADGSFDDTFFMLQNNDTDCSVPGHGYAAESLALLPDGRIVVGGHFYYFVDPLAQAPNLALLRSNGLPDFPVYADGPVYALAVQPDGNILIGGDFASVNDVPRERIARMNADTSIDVSFDPGANGAVRALSMRGDGRFFAGGDFTSIGDGSRDHIALLDAQGQVENFNHDVNGPVNALALQSDGKIALGGSFTSVDGFPHSNVARIHLPDPAWYAIDYVPRRPLPPWVYWVQHGAGPAPGPAPQLSYSLDGITYTNLGAMTFDPDQQRWAFDSFTPPLDQLVFLRVRAESGGGIVETIRPIFNGDSIFKDGFDS